MRLIVSDGFAAIIVAFVGLLHWECAIANPTKEETVKFLAEKTSFTVVQFDSNTLTVELIATDNPCRLISGEMHRTPEGRLRYVDVTVLALKDLNPTTITTGRVRSHGVFAEMRYGLQSTNWLVFVSTTGKTESIVSKRVHYDQQSGAITKEDVTMVDHTQVLVENQDAALRVSKALTHLVGLCGGKDELF